MHVHKFTHTICKCAYVCMYVCIRTITLCLGGCGGLTCTTLEGFRGSWAWDSGFRVEDLVFEVEGFGFKGFKGSDVEIVGVGNRA